MNMLVGLKASMLIASIAHLDRAELRAFIAAAEQTQARLAAQLGVGAIDVRMGEKTLRHYKILAFICDELSKDAPTNEESEHARRIIAQEVAACL